MDIKRAAEVKVREKDGGRARNPSVSNNPGEKKIKIMEDKRYVLAEGDFYLWVRKEAELSGLSRMKLKVYPVPSVSPSSKKKKALWMRDGF